MQIGEGNVIEYEDLLECGIIPRGDTKTIIDWSNFCGREYWKWEDAVKLYLYSHGWKYINFQMGERDAFGPLTRIMTGVDKDGVRRTFVYG